METLAGKTGLEILANGGIDERFIGSLTAPPFNARFSPVIESLAVLEGIGAVPLYGVDLTGAPGNAIVPSRALAQRLHLAVDAPLAVPQLTGVVVPLGRAFTWPSMRRSPWFSPAAAPSSR
jgi:hypothetical protein